MKYVDACLRPEIKWLIEDLLRDSIHVRMIYGDF